jgi:hypothetical protein
MKRLQAPAFLAGLERKARKRKADREYVRKKRKNKPQRKAAEYRNGHKPKVSPPMVTQPRAWPPEEKAHWQAALCEWLTAGKSLVAFCSAFPQGPARMAWFNWLRDDPTFAECYSRAREAGADALADDCIAIADDAEGEAEPAAVNAAKLRVNTRQWMASKLRPKVYADRVETVTSGALTVHHTISDDERARALATILQRQAIVSAQSLPDARRLIEAQAIDVTPAKPVSPAAAQAQDKA